MSQANAELAALEARRDAERFERHQALFDKYQELTHARHELGSLRERMLPMAESALATTRRGFEQGRFSYLSLAQAQRTLFRSSLACCRSRRSLSPSAGRGGTPHRHR
ncbi:TolC family protein [Pseudomonas aeruginosa]|nr:TolC family protein [Pseudomonas aeruginosa]